MTDKKIKCVLVVGALLIFGAVGCTSPSNPVTGPALTMSATYANGNYSAYYGQIIVVTADVTNNHAGTLKLSTDNFIMQDSKGYTHTTIGHPAVMLLENSEGATPTINFQTTAGAIPSSLTYYDGTNKITCTIN